MISGKKNKPFSQKKFTARFWIIATCLGLLLLGAWQGDYRETLLNGTAL